MHHRKSFVSVLVSAALCATAGAQTYTFREIPTPLSLFAYQNAFAITDSGSYLIVLGSQSGPNSAFILTGTKLTAVPANNGDGFQSLNSDGFLVGSGINGGFIQDKTGKQTLLKSPVGDQLAPFGLNNKGVVVGEGINSSGNYYGFTWKAGTVTVFNYPGSQDTTITSINDNGDMVGVYIAGAQQDYYAFLVKAGKASTIGVSTFGYTYPSGINLSRTIVGAGQPIGASQYAPFVGFTMNPKGVSTTYDWSPGFPKACPGPKSPLQNLPSSNSFSVWGVNKYGAACGQFYGSYQDMIMSYAISLPIAGAPGGA
jgi:hypothetical protein